MALGNKIAQYRKKMGLTQEALAQKLSVSNQAVSKWESDVCCPDVMLLPQIADVFGVSMDELFSREVKREKSENCLPWEDDGALRAVLYVGHQLIDGHPAAKEIVFTYEGPALNIYSDFAVQCESVGGSVTANGDVSCDCVGGSVQAEGDVECDSVGGNVKAGGNVNCDSVGGSVQAGGSANCDEVSGNVTANGSVTCDDVGGSIRAGGSVTCDTVDGDVNAGGNVTCDEVCGDVSAGGSVFCDHMGDD